MNVTVTAASAEVAVEEVDDLFELEDVEAEELNMEWEEELEEDELEEDELEEDKLEEDELEVELEEEDELEALILKYVEVPYSVSLAIAAR